MLLSRYFLPIQKENPAEAQVISHSLMLRSGMIKQQCAGIYSWLPFGLKVMRNIESIVRFNMDAIGYNELLMPCVQSADLWIESGRLDGYGKEMLKFRDRHDHTLLFGPTNEEVICDIFRKFIKSYKELPRNFYHIQWKFRDEIRPRFGVMRGREFLMKDAYSFDIDKASAVKSYNRMYAAYMHTFRDLGLSVVPVKADNGVIGGDLSHEFHVIAATGESTLYYDKKFEILAEDPSIEIDVLQSLYAAAEEKHDSATCPLSADQLRISKGIEVGHIFYSGDKYSKAMSVYVNNQNGELVPVETGAYGIGVSRLVAAIIEASHDDKGIIWPMSVAPFKASILNLNMEDESCNQVADYLHNCFGSMNIDVLYDDTLERPGSKFATHDLIGSPWQIIIGPKKAVNQIVELKDRKTGETDDLPLDVVVKKILGTLNLQ